MKSSSSPRGRSAAGARNFLPPYGVALMAVALALLGRGLLEGVLGHRAAFLLFTLAVMLSAWYGGLRPGLLATVLGGLAGTFLFLEPSDTFGVPNFRQAVQLGLFLIVGCSISWLNEALIAARRRAEKNASAAESAHRETVSTLERISDGFMAFDPQWRWTYLNRSAAALTRRPRQELLGKNLWQEFPDAFTRDNAAQLRRSMEEKLPIHIENFYPAFQAWLEIDAYPSADGVSVFLRDITERKRAEEGLSRLAAIVENSDDAIIGLSLDGTILTWNAGAQRIYGYAAEEVAGRPVSVLLPPERTGEVLGLVGQLQRGERIVNYETVRLRKDGARIQVLLTISPIRDKAGNLIGASDIERDITERKRLEEQLRQSQKLESLGVLAGGVAHDFNNLLTGIMGNAGLVLEDMPRSNSTYRRIEEILRASERASHLTSQMLAYSGKGRFFIEPVDLSKLVRQISALLEVSVPKRVQLRLELADDLPLIEADVSQMQQLVINLVINAAESIAEDSEGAIVITTSPGVLGAGACARLEVRDTGCGMDEETISKIFDPFFTTKFTGRGLGLAAVLGIVRGHKGDIQVESTPGKGSTFRVLLPAVQANWLVARSS